MITANDNTAAHPDYTALSALSPAELHTLAFMVDRRDCGVLFEAPARGRLAFAMHTDGTLVFEAPREPWDAAVDLRVVLRCGSRADAVAATDLPLWAIDAFAAGLA